MTSSTSRNIEFGNICCAGGGEIYVEVYVDGVRFGEAWGLNGTQEGEEPTFPSVEEYYEAHQDAIEAFEGEMYSCTCPHCGKEYFAADDKYRNEYPNSCDMAEGQAWENHNESCEEYQKIHDPFWEVKNSPEAIALREKRMENINFVRGPKGSRQRFNQGYRPLKRKISSYLHFRREGEKFSLFVKRMNDSRTRNRGAR